MFWTNFPLRIDATTQIICKIEIIIIVGKKLKLTDVASFSSFFFFFFSDPDKKINFVIFSLIVLKVRCYVSDEVDELILRLLMLIKQTSKKIKYKKDIFPQ